MESKYYYENEREFMMANAPPRLSVPNSEPLQSESFLSCKFSRLSKYWIVKKLV